MNQDDCRLLDDFLDRTLSGPELGDFQQHLEHCEACRQEVSLQQNVSQLLREAASQQPLPEAFVAKLRRNVRHHAYQRTMVLSAVAIAACLLLALGIWGVMIRDDPSRTAFPGEDDQADTEQVADGTRPGMKPEDTVPVTPVVAFSGDVIAVERKTQSPNVSFYQVYSTIERPRTEVPEIDGEEEDSEGGETLDDKAESPKELPK